jgi:hypothetical protein
VRLDLGSNGDLRGEREELARVGRGDVRDGADRAFQPQVVVVEGRDLVEVDRVDDDGSTAVEGAQGGDDDRTDRGERDRGVERFGRPVVVAADGRGTERNGALAIVRRPGRDVDAATPVGGDLDREQGRRAEAVQTEAATAFDPGQAERPVADDAATQERRGLEVAEAVREPDGDVRADRARLGIAPVPVPAGERRVRAEVLATGAAERAGAVEAREPGDPGAVADRPALHVRTDGVDHADDLVTGHDRLPMRRDVAGRELEIRAADRAGGNLESHLARAGDGDVTLLDPERALLDRRWPTKDRGTHQLDARPDLGEHAVGPVASRASGRRIGGFDDGGGHFDR